MRTRTQLVAGILFIGVGALLLAWQASSDRLATGLALATPWAVSGVAILAMARAGAWLGVLVSLISAIAAGWIFFLAGGGEGRDIAEALFASRGGFFTWADVAIISAGLLIVSLVALALAALVASRAQPDPSD
jgi:hypothetical protein